MSFDEKIMGGNKKLRLMSQFSIKVSVGHPPPKSLFNDDGTLPEQFFFAAPK
jgi:hypothetical protein